MRLAASAIAGDLSLLPHAMHDPSAVIGYPVNVIMSYCTWVASTV
jgi:hypothetical protein